ncbi:MAG: hypothetical protein JSS90_06265 [Bacteroidetes bacterium]|jgi:hypothetical protein|nr:hypothetical protein [Bacteroidota bacterium]
MTKQSVIEEVRIALDQISRQYDVFTAGNRIPEDDELDMLKGKIIRLYDKINMLQLVEGSPVQPPVQQLPSSGIELKNMVETPEAPKTIATLVPQIEEETTVQRVAEPVTPVKQILSTDVELKPTVEPPAAPEIIATVPTQLEKEHTVQHVAEPVIPVQQIQEPVMVAQEAVKPAVAEVQATRSGIFKDSEPTIAQQFHESETIHDKIGAAQHAFAVADKLKLTPVADLVKAIGVNERFLFISHLFNNNQQVYQQTIAKLNSAQNFAEAYMYFDTEVSTQFKADKTSDVYRQFIDLLQRRFI